MTSKEINDYITANKDKADDILAKALGITKNAVEHRRARLGLKKEKQYQEAKPIDQAVRDDINAARGRKDAHDERHKNKFLMKENERLALEVEAMMALSKPFETFTISAKTLKGQSEATAFLIASDWHIEEPVRRELVNGLNHYDLEESKKRAETFFRNGLRLINIFRKDVEIKQMVLGLLGDFITNSIHEDSMEDNLLSPVDAALRCRDYITAGIQFILDNSDLTLYIPCHTGNHGRMTRERRVATESGNSIERLMYAAIQSYFRTESRVQFNVAEGYHSYLDIYGSTIRFHHGHAINYGGGVGGITIPVRKAINQWQRGRKADLDVFGHFHQFLDGGSFVANGSMIGYNAYAVSIKAEFEKPKQGMFLWDKKRGKTLVAPILFD